MKKYVAPSIEMNKFDVEDIITASAGTVVSGGEGSYSTGSLSEASKNLYSAYMGTSGANDAGAYAEFQW